MATDLLAGLGLDRYDRNARLAPAVIALAPALLVVFVWLPKVWTFYAGATALVVSGGFAFLLMSLARKAGKSVERRLIAELGAMPTVLLLRHRDTHATPEQRVRWHATLERQGYPMPTSAEEAADPNRADALYQVAMRGLLNRLRDPEANKLLLNNNIEYGFRRNMLGLRPWAIAILVLAAACDALALWMTPKHDVQWWAGVSLEIAALGLLLVWILTITKQFVIEASWTYAHQFHSDADRL